VADLAGCVNLKGLEIAFLECSSGVGPFLEAFPTTPVTLEQFVIKGKNLNSVYRLCHARRPDEKTVINFSSLKKIVAEVTRLDSMKKLFLGFAETSSGLIWLVIQYVSHPVFSSPDLT